mgnify:CR=1 FL=1
MVDTCVPVAQVVRSLVGYMFELLVDTCGPVAQVDVPCWLILKLLYRYLLDLRNAMRNVLADLKFLYKDLGREDFLLVAQNSIQLASFI